MRERSSPRTPLSFLFTRDAARRAAAFLATLGLASAGIALGATSATPFQVAYIYGTSGPAGGGTPVNVVGNQFAPGATATIGGVGVGAIVTSSTRIGVTSPALSPGALYDVIIDNGAASGVLPKGWFADFGDVAAASPFHAPVETIIRDGITSGCGGGNYCPSSSVTRAQMAVFLLRAEHGSGYVPPPATGTIFGDVHQGDFAADWIEQLYAEGITGGCQAGTPPNYCPSSSVTRGQMAAFLLKIYHGSGYAPPVATGVFSDVPTSLPLAPWIEELARLAVTSGCGGSQYCPGNAVTRGQMAVFLAKTFHRPEATRFLEQATWGPKDSEISGVLGVGYLSWMASQYSLPASIYPPQNLVPDSTPPNCGDGTGAAPPNCRRDNYSTWPLYTTFFTNALYQPDQLRQRVFFALHKIDVDLDEQRRPAEPVHPVPEHPGEQRLRQLPRHPLRPHAESRDGRVPQHEHVHQEQPERELPARDHAALLDRDGPAQPGRHDAERPDSRACRCRPTTSPSSTISSSSSRAGRSRR